MVGDHMPSDLIMNKRMMCNGAMAGVESIHLLQQVGALFLERGKTTLMETQIMPLSAQKVNKAYATALGLQLPACCFSPDCARCWPSYPPASCFD